MEFSFAVLQSIGTFIFSSASVIFPEKQSPALWIIHRSPGQRFVFETPADGVSNDNVDTED